MKKMLFTAICAFLPFLLSAQNREKLETVNPIYQEFLPLQNGKITYSEVVTVDALSKDEIYLRANDWIIKTFNSAKDVIQFNDKESGKIVCKTITGATIGKGWNKITIYPVYYLITIESRDGRYRITASDFIHHYDIQLGQVKNEGENPLEAYFLLKDPTKKEVKKNMEVAEIIYNNIQSTFTSAYKAITEKKNDDW